MPIAVPRGLSPLPYYLPSDLADWVAYMQTYGWMGAAPVVAPGAKDVHFDSEIDQHIGVAGDEHFDRED